MRVALIQLCSTDDPELNLTQTLDLIDQAKDADLIVTPEVTNCISADRPHQGRVLVREDQDKILRAVRKQALIQEKWIILGSLALRTGDAEGRFANRSILIGPDGDIHARYDKIHMFDVQVSAQETYHESAAYRPGDKAVLGQTDHAVIGMTICYDMRFPALFRKLAKAGAEVITVPSAFSPETGPAHWEVLLRARAIETGAFVVAPAQCGTHPASTGRQRRSHGHSLVVSPWGEVLADGGTSPGVISVDLNLELVAEARQRIPALTHEGVYRNP